MPELVTITQNDVQEELLIDIYDFDPQTGLDSVKDLSAVGTQVYLKARPVDGGALKVDGTCTPVDAAQGQFKYVFQPTDVDTAGEFTAEISILYPSGRLITYKRFSLSIQEELS